VRWNGVGSDGISRIRMDRRGVGLVGTGQGKWYRVG